MFVMPFKMGIIPNQTEAAMQISLSTDDLSHLSVSARAELLDFLGSRVLPEETPVGFKDEEFDEFDMVDVAELTYSQVRQWMEGASAKTRAGLRVFAEHGPIVHVRTLVDAGVENPGHFQSRTTIRTRTVTGKKKAFLLGWDDWEGGEGNYAVTPTTYLSLRRYFQLDNGKE